MPLHEQKSPSEPERPSDSRFPALLLSSAGTRLWSTRHPQLELREALSKMHPAPHPSAARLRGESRCFQLNRAFQSPGAGAQSRGWGSVLALGLPAQCWAGAGCQAGAQSCAHQPEAGSGCSHAQTAESWVSKAASPSSAPTPISRGPQCAGKAPTPGCGAALGVGHPTRVGTLRNPLVTGDHPAARLRG